VDHLEYQDCIRLLQRTWKERDPYELKDAVSALDSTGNGYLTIDQFKKSLVNLGEALDEDDFKELLKNVQVQADGTINTEGKFRTALFIAHFKIHLTE
jgi:calcium-binding protein CML